jgi:hypothetical protein
MNHRALANIADCAQLFYIKATGQFGTNQQAADVAVIELWMELGQHPDAHPVFGLRIDRATQRIAGDAQVLMHVF